jgi:hypothetical protein
MLPFSLSSVSEWRHTPPAWCCLRCFLPRRSFSGRRSLGFSPLWSALALAFALLSVSGSEKMRELYWGHIIYYSLGRLFLTVGLTLATSALRQHPFAKTPARGPDRKRISILRGILCLWVFLCSVNGLQGLFTFGAPLLCARTRLVFHVRFTEGIRSKRSPACIATVSLSCLLGMFAAAALTAVSYMVYRLLCFLSATDQWMAACPEAAARLLSLLDMSLPPIPRSDPLPDWET